MQENTSESGLERKLGLFYVTNIVNIVVRDL